MRTFAGSPLSAQPARNGGNIIRSVSSWAGTTLRRGGARVCRRIPRFFLALGVRVEHVAWPLPEVTEPPDPTPHRLVRRSEPQVLLQLLPEEGDRPVRVRIAEVLGRLAHQRRQEAVGLLGPKSRASAPVLVTER